MITAESVQWVPSARSNFEWVWHLQKGKAVRFSDPEASRALLSYIREFEKELAASLDVKVEDGYTVFSVIQEKEQAA